MKIRWLGSLAVIVLISSVGLSSARADDYSWEVRLRGAYLDPMKESYAIPGLVPEDAITINHKWLPDLDFEYFFTPQWSTELVLTYPQSQDVYLEGTQIGTFKHLPPTLTAKYNFLPNSDFQPYLGAGLNFTIISDVNIVVPGVSRLYLDNNSWGPALQTGLDYKFREHWYLNADVKWIRLHSDLYLPGGTRISTLQLNPWLVGVGVGYRFGARK